MDLGFVGLGAMGGPIVHRLLTQGHRVVVFDVANSAINNAVSQGAISAKSPAAVGSQAETVLVSLPTPDVVKNVVLGTDGLIEGSKIKHYVDLSTTGAKTAIHVADELALKSITAIDAPVSGGVRTAAQGNLALMASGDELTYQKLEELLKTIGSRITYVGDKVGHAQTLKLINNLLVATSLASAAEALALGKKAGLPLDTLLQVINASSGRSFATDTIFPSTLPERTFDFGFRTELMHKDVRLCLDEAENLGMPMWVGNNILQIWSFAMKKGMGKTDFSYIATLFEDWADLDSDPTPSRIA